MVHNKTEQFKELVAQRALLEYAAHRAEETGSYPLVLAIARAKSEATKKIDALETELSSSRL